MPAPSAAQTAYGGLVGVVRDAQGGALPAAVTIIEMGTNLKRETVTDAQGGYNFVNVLAGQYEVRIAMASFREAVRTGVPVTVGQISRVDVTMELGALTETVTVKSAAELLQTDKADVRTDLKAEEVANLPLNSFRNYQSLVVLVPGSLPPTFQNAETDTPQRSLAMTVNGQSGNANERPHRRNGERVRDDAYTRMSRRPRRSRRSASRPAAWTLKPAWRRRDQRRDQVRHQHVQGIRVRVLQQRS